VSPARARISRIAAGAGLALVLVAGARDVGRLGERWPKIASLGLSAPAPEFSLPLLDGGRFERAELEGGVTALIFWATWCGVCKTQMPTYEQVRTRLPDVRLLAVAREGGPPDRARATVAEFVRARGIELEVALDPGPVGSTFGVYAVPHVVLIDRKGVVRHVHVGRVAAATLGGELEVLLAEPG